MKKLGELFEIGSGGTPSKTHPEYYRGSIPWVKTGDLKTKYLYKVEDYITEEGLKNSAAKLYDVDTVLIAMYGATIGATSILKLAACTNQACAAFRRSEEVLPEYLYYFLKSQKNKFVKAGVGGAQPNISIGYLKNVELDVKPITEQQKIVQILENANNIATKYQCQHQKLDELVKARFVEMFGMPGTDVFGWGLVPLGSACNINPKKIHDSRLVSSTEVSFVPMSAVTERGEIDATAIKEYDEVKTGFTYFAENDVLFAKITPCMENGKGAVAKSLRNGIGFGSTEFHVLRPIVGKTDPYWIYTLTAFSQFRMDASNNMTGSAGQRRVPASFLENYRVSLPPIALQEQFAAFVEQTNKSKAAVEKASDEARSLFDCLMQEYFK